MMLTQARSIDSQTSPVRNHSTLDQLLQSIQPAPQGIPQSLWKSALAGPITEFLTRPGKQFRHRFVELAWQLGGQADSPPPILGWVVELLHAGSLIVDDIQDDSLQRRGRPALHRQIGLPLALNAGNWLYFWPMKLIRESHFDPSVESRLIACCLDTIQRCHEGQALDLAAKIGELHPSEIRPVVQTISAWKTGSLMALAGSLGAIAADAPPETFHALEQFGEHLGIALQMQNDLSELTGAAGPLKHPEDLIHGRATWPWAWAAERLPSAQFDWLQLRAAKLTQGIGCAATLADDLLAALGSSPARLVRDWLDSAWANLTETLPDSPAMQALHAEIKRLETRYV
ncbi:polyprenyl synthetase family protein [Tuwongella immobilis]|uniref:Uncharacterized protein n=1 Tax=Tuwongella immobilis TaxID=692036 RepID=A0A6C2YMY5_9BACT|nr:polyprenyl synthetase family protein [Tuwongella immobilis]VIP02737.1 polyprenyl synthetase : Polyprenyl synthetase OS=Pseudomonas sp. FH1 GN=H096_02975 PE=3 SV=1: polyprenyl_synt [Tuwongella immobilis]VTS02301.1 polyprenyl synthetase : Polyprenyl synthetase OS=Pseudomonas sp. FH1 GN=H096_02975 PE=3 SV=1: polyprenyl_synt [Tuwongella immobilis]